MGALAWLVIPVTAAVAAALWGRWAARTRSTADGASLAGYERFRQAMQSKPDQGGPAADDADTEAA